jgi:hypothetical protein
MPALTDDPAELLGDQAWRLDRLYTVTDKNGRKVPFRMNWAQREIFEGLHSNNLILKARQLGCSTLINLLMLDTCLFNANIECGVIAHAEDAAKRLFQRNVKEPLDALPESLRALNPVVSDSAHLVRFANGSSIAVATSLRGSSPQILHVSEFGKICARYPDRAREVVTGSLEAVGEGNLTFVESTAEGSDGYFYEYCMAARALADSGKAPMSADFKFFFFPWWREPSYASTAQQPFDDGLHDYFEKLCVEHRIDLTPEQKNWYAAKRARLDDDVYREYPSTPDESFRASLDGAYYAAQIARARREGRIAQYPPDPRYPFRVYADLGIADDTCLLFEQCVRGQHRIFDFVENANEPIQWYVNKIQEHLRSGLVLDKVYLPHDARKRDLASGKSLEDVVLALGLRPVEVLPATDVAVGIQAVRDRLTATCFNEPRTAALVKHLENYRREWNARLGAWSDRPRHDEHSHAADAFRYFAVVEQDLPQRAKQRPTRSALLC